ncbi:proteasome subunit alpha type-5-like [Eutrema salsugineum]|uniref:proteasome subunit alpha type-5-like n=1 Tax=Eutrema salsugineum TaxID=72664 RepID=UPI000CED39BC|nr:proteasome subunit alpha type-5-like [Eutrema salsugineum]
MTEKSNIYLQGRLFQVDYATEATKLGSTAVDVKTKEGVVLEVEKPITSPVLIRALLARFSVFVLFARGICDNMKKLNLSFIFTISSKCRANAGYSSGIDNIFTNSEQSVANATANF